MSPVIHKNLNSDRWQQLSLPEQLANIGSEVNRACKWEGKDEEVFWGAVARALELFDLTLKNCQQKAHLREIARARELFLDAVSGGKEYKTTLKGLESYFFHFAFLSQNRA